MRCERRKCSHTSRSSSAKSGLPARRRGCLRPAETRPFDEWVARFRRGAVHALDRDVIRSALSHGPEVEPEREEEAQSEVTEFPIGLTGFDVMNSAIGAMQTLVNRYRLAGSPPDVLVTIPASDVRMLDFDRAESMIELGRDAAAQALEEAGLGD